MLDDYRSFGAGQLHSSRIAGENRRRGLQSADGAILEFQQSHQGVFRFNFVQRGFLHRLNS